MILSGTFTFEGPRSRVWEILQDPAVLAKALPGTKTLTKVGEDKYQGVMKVSVGPVNAAEFAINLRGHGQRFGIGLGADGDEQEVLKVEVAAGV